MDKARALANEGCHVPAERLFVVTALLRGLALLDLFRWDLLRLFSLGRASAI
jgi:hypothetical protein